MGTGRRSFNAKAQRRKDAKKSVQSKERQQGLPQYKTLRDQFAPVPVSARSWTAPALWRFYLRHHQSTLVSNSSTTEMRSVLNRHIDFTIAVEAVRSNHAAERHGYWQATGTSPCFTAF
jgi:DNA-binding transcriptional LysR family regulator